MFIKNELQQTPTSPMNTLVKDCLCSGLRNNNEHSTWHTCARHVTSSRAVNVDWSFRSRIAFLNRPECAGICGEQRNLFPLWCVVSRAVTIKPHHVCSTRRVFCCRTTQSGIFPAINRLRIQGLGLWVNLKFGNGHSLHWSLVFFQKDFCE